MVDPTTAAPPARIAGAALLPPRLVLFDGECGFCSRVVRFLHARDPTQELHFAPLQGATAEMLGIDAKLDAMLYVEDGVVFTRSTAALRIARRLAWPWPWWAACASLVPKRARDAAYDAIAKRRHRVARACLPPDASLRARMME